MKVSKIIQGDCLEKVKEIPDSSVDLVIGDPPYGIDYNEIIEKSMEKLKDSGTLLLFIFPDDIWKIKYPAKQIIVWEEVYSPQGRFIQKYRRFFDFILWYPKSENYIFNQLARYQLRGIFNDSFEYFDEKKHPHQKPLSLIKKLVYIHSNPDDLVLDLFAGSGTTGVVCEQLERDYILIEKEEKYIELAEKRIKAVQNPLL